MNVLRYNKKANTFQFFPKRKLDPITNLAEITKLFPQN